MSEFTKPPIGCTPAFISSSCRIEELAEAIIRNVRSEKMNAENVKTWAKEIIHHCEILEEC